MATNNYNWVNWSKSTWADYAKVSWEDWKTNVGEVETLLKSPLDKLCDEVVRELS